MALDGVSASSRLARRSSQPKFLAIWVGLYMALLAWLFQGYRFPHSNQGQEIPPIQAILDRNLFLTDFSVQSFLEPGPRYFYYHLIASTAGGLEIDIDVALLLWKILSQLAFFLAIAFLANSALDEISESESFGERPRALASVALAVCCILPVASWGSEIFFPVMVPSTLAMAIATWAFYFAIRDRWNLAFLVAGIASIFQILVGAFAGLVLLPALLHAALRYRSMRVLLAPLLWIGPVIIIFLMTLVGAREVPESFNFFTVFGEFRVPHHWLPSTGTWKHWLADGSLLVAGIVALLVLMKGTIRGRRVAALLGSIVIMAVLGVLANAIFGELLHVTFIGKLQFQRIMPFGHLAIYLLVILAITYTWRSRPSKYRGNGRLLATAAAFLASPSVLAITINDGREGDVVAPALLLVLLATGILFAVSGQSVRIALSALAAAMLLFVNLPVAERLPNPFAQYLDQKYRPTDERKWGGIPIADWLRENSPTESIVIIPPDGNEFSEFLAMYSHRSLYFSFKNVPYSDYGVWEWSQRAASLIGRGVDGIAASALRGFWQGRSFSDIRQVAREWGACYLVDRLEDRGDVGYQPVATANVDGTRWGLWIMDDCGTR